MSQWLPSLNPSFGNPLLLFPLWRELLYLAWQGISQSAHLCRCPVWRESVLCLDDRVLSTVGARWTLKGAPEEVPCHPRRNGLCLLHSVNREVHWGRGFPTQEQRLLSRADVSTLMFSRSKAALEILRKLQKVQSPVPSAPVTFTLTKLSCREHSSYGLQSYLAHFRLNQLHEWDLNQWCQCFCPGSLWDTVSTS